MTARRMSVVLSSSEDGPAFLPDVPPGTVEEAVDAVPPAPAVVAGVAVDAGAALVGGVVVPAVGGTVPAGTDELEVAVPGVVSLSCDWPGACAEAGRGTAASAAQQIPAVRRRRRIRRHRLTKRFGAPSLTTARR
jgi:hypothetical protein